MRKIYAILILLVVTLTACSSKDTVAEEKNTIYTSIYPVYYVASNIAGDKLEVKNIMPNDSDPHSWEPTPKDMAKFEDSKLIMINGLGMESWIDSIGSVVDKDKIFEVNKGIDLINLDEKEHDGHDHGEHDPHIWMSVKNMKVVAENVYEKIVEVDKENEEYYKENYEELTSKFDKLDEEYSSALEKYKGKGIVVPHEAYGYLVRDYELVQIPIEGINSDSEPDLGKMAEIVKKTKENKINTIFFEFGGSEKISKTIAGEIKGNTLPLYSIENITKEQEEKGEDYISMMEKNLENLEKSFEE